MESYGDWDSQEPVFDGPYSLNDFSATWSSYQPAAVSELTLFESDPTTSIYEAPENGTVALEISESLQREMQTDLEYLRGTRVPVAEAASVQPVIVKPDGPNDPAWEHHRDAIIKLYWNEERPLSEIMKTMKEVFNFSASEKQYKIQLGPKFWNLGKNLKTKEAEAMVKIQYRREIEDRKNTAFRLRKRPVPPEKIIRFAKRRKILLTDDTILAESVPTPSDISYYTPDEDVSSGVSDDQATPRASPTLKSRQPSEDSHFNTTPLDHIGIESLELRTPPCLPDTMPSPSGNIQSWLRDAVRSPPNSHQPQTPNSDFFNYQPDEFSFLFQVPEIMTQVDRLTEAVARTRLQDEEPPEQTGPSLSLSLESAATSREPLAKPLAKPPGIFGSIVAIDDDLPVPEGTTCQLSRHELEGNSGGQAVSSVDDREGSDDLELGGTSSAAKAPPKSSRGRIKDEVHATTATPPGLHLLTGQEHNSSSEMDRSPATERMEADEPIDFVDSDDLVEICPPSPVHPSEDLDDDLVVVNDSSSFEQAILRFKNERIPSGRMEALDRQLRFAAKTGDIVSVRASLDEGAAIDGRSTNGMTALHLAAYMGHTSVVDVLLERGGRTTHVEREMVFRLDGHNETISEPSLLHLAALRGHTETTRAILQRSDIDDYDIGEDEGFSLVRWVIETNNRELVELFLENGMDLDLTTWCVDFDDYIPLITFASYMEKNEMMLCLLDAGADVATIPFDKSPLKAAIEEGNKSVVDALIQYGARVDGYGGDGDTPIHCAIRERHIDIAKLLLEAGANPDTTDRNGDTALSRLILRSYLRTVSKKFATERLDLVRLLLDHGADVNQITDDQTGQTPLHRAVMDLDAPLVSELLRYGADIHKMDKEPWGLSPQHIASIRDAGPIVTAFARHRLTTELCGWTLHRSLAWRRHLRRSGVLDPSQLPGIMNEWRFELSTLDVAVLKGDAARSTFLLHEGAFLLKEGTRIFGLAYFDSRPSIVSLLDCAIFSRNIPTVKIVAQYYHAAFRLCPPSSSWKPNIVFAAVMGYWGERVGGTRFSWQGGRSKLKNIVDLLPHPLDADTYEILGIISDMFGLRNLHIEEENQLILLCEVVFNGRVTSLQRLLAPGFAFNVNSRDDEGRTIIHHIAHHEVAKEADLSKIAGILLHYQLDLLARDDEGHTALHYGLASGNQRFLGYWLRALGFDVLDSVDIHLFLRNTQYGDETVSRRNEGIHKPKVGIRDLTLGLGSKHNCHDCLLCIDAGLLPENDDSA